MPLYTFMIAASYNESPLSIIYTLLRQVASFIINYNSNRVRVLVRTFGNIQIDLKRKRRC